MSANSRFTNTGKRGAISYFSILSIIALMLIIAAAWNLLDLARNIYLGNIKGNSETRTCPLTGRNKFEKNIGNLPDEKIDSIFRKLKIGFYLVTGRIEHTNNEENLRLNENITISLLKKYAKAQGIYSKHYGCYAKNAADLIIDENGKYQIIDSGLKVLNFATNEEKASNGYYFVAGAGEDNRSEKNQFGLTAVPAKYKVSGIYTFYIDSREIVFKKDNKGNPVFNRKDIDDSWIALKMTGDDDL